MCRHTVLALSLFALAACDPRAEATDLREPSNPPQPSSVVISPPTLRLTSLEAFAGLTATVRDQYGQPMPNVPVKWTTSNQPVAGVDRSDQPGVGVVFAWANGTAIITATVTTAPTVSGTATITVRQEAAAIAVSPTSGVLVKGDTLRLSAEATDANGHLIPDAVFAWSSSAPSVASVDGTGLVTGLAKGAVTVIATSAAATSEGGELLVVDGLFPIHIHDVGNTVSMKDFHREELAEAVERWGRALAPSDARPYVFMADARCPNGGPSFEAGDTLAAGIHVWLWIRDRGTSNPGATRCGWASEEDAASVPDSLRKIPGGTVSFHTCCGGAFMHEIGHVLQQYPMKGYTYRSGNRQKTIYYASGDRAVEAIEIMRQHSCEAYGTSPCPDMDWARAFPGGLRGIPLLSYYDGISLPISGHLNPCIGANADHWAGGDNVATSQVANDVMTLSSGPQYITVATLAMIDFPGYRFTPYLAEARLKLGHFSEKGCYG